MDSNYIELRDENDNYLFSKDKKKAIQIALDKYKTAKVITQQAFSDKRNKKNRNYRDSRRRLGVIIDNKFIELKDENDIFLFSEDIDKAKLIALEKHQTDIVKTENAFSLALKRKEEKEKNGNSQQTLRLGVIVDNKFIELQDEKGKYLFSKDKKKAIKIALDKYETDDVKTRSAFYDKRRKDKQRKAGDLQVQRLGVLIDNKFVELQDEDGKYLFFKDKDKAIQIALNKYKTGEVKTRSSFYADRRREKQKNSEVNVNQDENGQGGQKRQRDENTSEDNSTETSLEQISEPQKKKKKSSTSRVATQTTSTTTTATTVTDNDGLTKITKSGQAYDDILEDSFDDSSSIGVTRPTKKEKIRSGMTANDDTQVADHLFANPVAEEEGSSLTTPPALDSNLNNGNDKKKKRGQRLGIVSEDDKFIELKDENGDCLFLGDEEKAQQIAREKYQTDTVCAHNTFWFRQNRKKKKKENAGIHGEKLGVIDQDNKFIELRDENGKSLFLGDEDKAQQIAKKKYQTDKVRTKNAFWAIRTKEKNIKQQGGTYGQRLGIVSIDNNFIELKDENGKFLFIGDEDKAQQIAKEKYQTDKVCSKDSFNFQITKEKNIREKGGLERHKLGIIDKDNEFIALEDENGKFLFIGDEDKAQQIAKEKYQTDKINTKGAYISRQSRERIKKEKGGSYTQRLGILSKDNKFIELKDENGKFLFIGDEDNAQQIAKEKYQIEEVRTKRAFLKKQKRKKSKKEYSSGVKRKREEKNSHDNSTDASSEQDDTRPDKREKLSQLKEESKKKKGGSKRKRETDSDNILAEENSISLKLAKKRRKVSKTDSTDLKSSADQSEDYSTTKDVIQAADHLKNSTTTTTLTQTVTTEAVTQQALAPATQDLRLVIKIPRSALIDAGIFNGTANNNGLTHNQYTENANSANLSLNGVIIKEEPLATRLSPIIYSPLDYDELRTVVAILRENSDSDEDCVPVSEGVIEYLRTRKMPTRAAATTSTSYTLDMDVRLISNAEIKQEPETSAGQRRSKRHKQDQVFAMNLLSTIDRNSPLGKLAPPPFTYDFINEDGIEKIIVRFNLDSDNKYKEKRVYTRIIEIETALQKEAENHPAKISFGIMGMDRCKRLKGHNEDAAINKAEDAISHTLVYYATPEKVIYIEGQDYDGTTLAGDPIIEKPLCEAYPFAKDSKPNDSDANLFGDFVFYTPLNVTFSDVPLPQIHHISEDLISPSSSNSINGLEKADSQNTSTTPTATTPTMTINNNLINSKEHLSKDRPDKLKPHLNAFETASSSTTTTTTSTTAGQQSQSPDTWYVTSVQQQPMMQPAYQHNPYHMFNNVQPNNQNSSLNDARFANAQVNTTANSAFPAQLQVSAIPMHLQKHNQVPTINNTNIVNPMDIRFIRSAPLSTHPYPIFETHQIRQQLQPMQQRQQEGIQQQQPIQQQPSPLAPKH